MSNFNSLNEEAVINMNKRPMCPISRTCAVVPLRNA